MLFQTLAGQASLIRAMRDACISPREASLLDVGCGGASSLLHLLPLGFRPERLTGLDFLEERLEAARAVLPNATFVQADARGMPFGDGSIDVVSEFTMFVELTDEVVARDIAREMLRVVRVGGHLVLYDWRYAKPRQKTKYCAMSRRRIASLFSIGTKTSVVSFRRGSLIPPAGRFLSKWAPWSYFLVQATMPFLAGQTVTVLRREC